MKSIFKLYFLLLSVVFAFTACSDEELDALTGKYPPPSENVLTGLLAKDVQKSGSFNIFTVKLATTGLSSINSGSGKYISVDFVGSSMSYFLPEGNYTIVNDGTLKASTYIAGYGDGLGTCWFDVQNGAATSKVKVINGSLNVVRSGDNYTISGILTLDDDTMIKVAYSGEIVYEPAPPAYDYKLEVSAPYAYTTDGQTYTPVPGTQLNKITVLFEGATVAYFEIVTEQGAASLTGTYPVKGLINTVERAVCQGQYLNLLWFGMFDMAIESGSYYEGTAGKMFIREGGGNINIVDNGSTLTITGSNLFIQDISTESAFGNLATRGSFDFQDMTLTGGGGGGVNGTVAWAANSQGGIEMTVTDNNFTMFLVLIPSADPFYSATGITYDLASTFAPGTIIPMFSTYDGGALSDGGSLTFTSDGTIMNISGTITTGAGSTPISGNYTM